MMAGNQVGGDLSMPGVCLHGIQRSHRRMVDAARQCFLAFVAHNAARARQICLERLAILAEVMPESCESRPVACAEFVGKRSREGSDVVQMVDKRLPLGRRSPRF